MKTDLDALIQSRIQSLVDEVQALVRNAAIEAVRNVLEKGSASSLRTAPAARPVRSTVMAQSAKPKELGKRPEPAKSSQTSQPSKGASKPTSDGELEVHPRPAASSGPGPGGQQLAARTDLETRLLAYVREKPGERMEEISRGLAIPSSEIKPIMRRLVRSGAVLSVGQRRVTKYFPAAPSPAPSSPSS
jgi:hypothetical protein